MEPFLFCPSSRIDWYRMLVSDPLSWSCVTALYCFFFILTLRACFEVVSGEGSMNPFYLRDRANEMRRLPSRLLSLIFPPVFLVDLASETYWIVYGRGAPITCPNACINRCFGAPLGIVHPLMNMKPFEEKKAERSPFLWGQGTTASKKNGMLHSRQHRKRSRSNGNCYFI